MMKMKKSAKRGAPDNEKPGSSGSSGGVVIGIDLGTTYSVVAVCRKNRVEILCNESGSRTTPSVVGFLEGSSYVGEAAKDLASECQVFDAKRLIGRPWTDAQALLSATSKMLWPFMVTEKNGEVNIRTDSMGKKVDFSPEEISALVLRHLKETAEGVLQETVTRAVVTVPAYFNERQRQATKLAGKLAGLDVVAMINEPTAAAMAYCLDKRAGDDDKKKTVFIYDLGGGTFDVSVMTVEGTDYRVLASDGDTQLGGQDFDARLMHTFIEEVRVKHNTYLDSSSVQELRRACELAKRKLSSLAEVPINVYFPRHNLTYKTSLTRARFEDLCGDYFKKTIEITKRVLEAASLDRRAIDEVVLVGGSTRIPKVRFMLRDFFDGKEPRYSINPDEAVAYGAAVHGAVVAGNQFYSNLVKLRDVTPLSLGIETTGGIFSVVVKKNTPIPCEQTSLFTNAHDYSKAINFKVFQGERPLTKDNHYLNKQFNIPVPRLRAGEAKLDCTFHIDADGLLTVTTVERETGASGHVTISQQEAKLTEAEIQKMIDKAEKFRQRDQQEADRIVAEERLKRRCL